MNKLPFWICVCLGSTALNAQSLYHACKQDDNFYTTENAAVTVDRFKFSPSVVRHNATGTVLMEASVVGTPSRVTLNVNGIFYDFNDNGTGGDRMAGDKIYSYRLPAQVITALLKPSDGYKPFLGFLELYEGGSKTSQLNVVSQVRTADMPDVSKRTFATGVQATDVVVNIVAKNDKTIDYQGVAKRFYQYYDDRYDFINFVQVPGYVGNRFHATIKNTVRGIGMGTSDGSSNYGSRGQLKGLNAFPVPSFYDPINNGFVHEFGHQWINFADGTPLDVGIPHWPYANIGYGVMGISIGGRNGAGGNFARIMKKSTGGYDVSNAPSGTAPVFNNWELYFMGLIGKREVTENAAVFKDQSAFPAKSFYADSELTEYSIDQLVSKFGERQPNASVSQKKFKVATILVSDTLLNNDELAFYHFITLRADARTPQVVREGLVTYQGNSFFVATGGRASLDVVLNSPAVSTRDLRQGFEVQAYPNPIQNELNLQFVLPEKDLLQAEVLDLLGRRVWRAKYPLGPGEHQLRLELGDLPQGPYYLHLSGEKYKAGLRLLK
jgi:hypothetical protein